VNRHPHIYGDVEVADEEEVKKNWEKLKLKEGNTSVLSGVPSALPAMTKAMRIQEKARGVGFDWEEPHQVWDKVQEELQELKIEVDQQSEQIENEMGDVLFSLINYARFLNINPENALEKTNKKFIKRFQFLEQKALAINKNLSDMTLAEMDVFWHEAKKL
jgi:XTP/dITP diphosphohydrolase